MSQNKFKISSRKTTSAKNRRTILLATFIVILVLIAVVASLCFMSPQKKVAGSGSITNATNTKPAGTINLNPPTPADKQAGDSQKDTIIKQQQAANQSTGSGSNQKVVVPLISYADANEVDAYIPGIVENDGSCTLTAIQNSKSFTKKVAAIADASTTRCQSFNLNQNDFSSNGTWQLSVRYDSSNASGTSAVRTVLVK